MRGGVHAAGRLAGLLLGLLGCWVVRLAILRLTPSKASHDTSIPLVKISFLDPFLFSFL
jgi:hypothetical protein